MLYFLSRIYNSVFIRNVGIVASGAVLAQVISVASSPFITRLYGPKALGLLGVFIAIVEVLLPVAALTYPISIVLPKDDKEAKNLASLSGFIAIVIAFIVAIVIMVAGEFIFSHFGAQEVSKFGLLIPLAMLFSSLLQISQQWLIRKKKFFVTAKIEIIQAMVNSLAKIGIGLFHPTALALIILSTIGNGIHAGMLVFNIKCKKLDLFKNSKNVNNHLYFFKLAKKYYDFPLYRAPQILINAVSQNLPILMLSAIFSPTSAGYYVICKRVLSIPSTLIAKSFGNVFYVNIVESAQNGRNLTKPIIEATIWLAAIGFVPFILLIIFGPCLFGFVFGNDWVTAGEYARWLSIMMFFFFVNKPCVAAVPVLGLQRGLLLYELFSTGAKFVAIFMGFVLFNDEKIAVALFSIFGSISYLLLIAWVVISSRYKNAKSQTG
ncbi:polysaccharide biosynthesis protein [Desulfosarcina variabilis str. Montpellier]|uniref:lipopolysaccharide biosynthesis protein n=1 Tax=Desulfosarcina variabilis TaxID=2300 RepID=UPI003AFAD219